MARISRKVTDIRAVALGGQAVHEPHHLPGEASGAGGAGDNVAAREMAHMIERRVAGRIRERRRFLGMTQQQLAGIIGVAFQQVHKYERAQSRISAGRLYVVAKALRAPLTYFFAADANPKPLEPEPESESEEAIPVGGIRSRRSSRFGFFRDRRGGVGVMVAILAPALILFAGLAAEVGLWYAIKRQNQSAADEAVISAAIEVDKWGYACQSTVVPPAPSDDVTGLTTQVATYNGFDSASPNSLTITCPYTDPYLASLSPPVTNAVEVETSQKQNTLFAAFALPFVTIKNRAVAALVPSNIVCSLLALDGNNPPWTGVPSYFGPANVDNHADSIYVAGGNNLTAPGICSNSNDSKSIFFQGGATGTNTSYITDLITMGNYATDLNYNAVIRDPTIWNTPAISDPYAGRVNYTAAWLAAGSPVAYKIGTSGPSINPNGTSNNVAYCPMYFSSGQSVTFQPGVYIIEGEDNQGNALTTKTGATLSGSGVTFILTSMPAGLSYATCTALKPGSKSGAGGAVNLQGGATTLSAPTSDIGSIPSGLLFYQDPLTADTSCVKANLEVSNCNNISVGLAGWSLTGVSDTPATTMSFQGNANSQCFLVIALAIFFNGGTGSTFSASVSACEAVGVSPPTGPPTVALLE